MPVDQRSETVDQGSDDCGSGGWEAFLAERAMKAICLKYSFIIITIWYWCHIAGPALKAFLELF